MTTAYFNEQLTVFIYSLIFGVFIGVIYDIFRLIRKISKYKISAEIICDILFMIVITLLTFIFIVIFNRGIIRFYIFLGELSGLLIFRYTFGLFTVKINFKLIKLIKKMFMIIFKPFVYLKNSAIKLMELIKGKKFKKIEKNINKPLKKGN